MNFPRFFISHLHNTMPCKFTNAKGQPCKRPTKTDCCASHVKLGGRVKKPDGIPGLPANYKPSKWFAPIKAVAKFLRPLTNRISAPIKGPQRYASDKLQAFLDGQEGKTVTKIQIGRIPIDSRVKKALDIMSVGRFSGKVKELGYDDAYHQYTLITLSDGKTYKIEKNEQVMHFPATKRDFQGQLFDVPLNGKQLTLPEMFDNASDGNEDRFWRYRADSDNCQKFTQDIIVKNGLLPDDPTPIQLQDAKAMTDSLPVLTHGIPQFITDTASVGRRIIAGDGAKKKLRAELFRN